MALDVEKLVFQMEVKGIPSAEAQRIAAMTREQLKEGARQINAAMVEAARKLQGDLTAEERKTTKERLASLKLYAQAAKATFKAIEVDANKSHNAFRNMLQDIKNVLHIHEMVSKSVGKLWNIGAAALGKYADAAKTAAEELQKMGRDSEGKALAQVFTDMEQTWKRFTVVLYDVGAFASLEMLGGLLEKINYAMTGIDKAGPQYGAAMEGKLGSGVMGTDAKGQSAIMKRRLAETRGRQMLIDALNNASRSSVYGGAGGFDMRPEYGPLPDQAPRGKTFEQFKAEAEARKKKRSGGGPVSLGVPVDFKKMQQDQRLAELGAMGFDDDLGAGGLEASLEKREEEQAKFLARAKEMAASYKEEQKKALAQAISDNNAMMDAAGIAHDKDGKPIGMLATMFFGADGVEGFRLNMEEGQEHIAGMVGIMEEAGATMKMALADNLTAALAGDKGFIKSMQQATKDMMKQISARAFVKSMEAVADGLMADAILPGSGSRFYVAAAKFAAVGAAAGLGARAVGASSGGSSSSTESPTSRRAPSNTAFASAGSGGGTAGGTSMVFNFGTVLGSKDDLGKVIMDALSAYQAKTGQRMAN